MSADPNAPDPGVPSVPARWVPILTTFAARLAAVRHEMGWNAKEAALACGLPAASWREWELNGREPRGIQKIVEKINERTGVDEYWLLTGKDIPEPPPVPPAGIEPAAFCSGEPLVFPQNDHLPSDAEEHEWDAEVIPLRPSKASAVPASTVATI